MAYYLAKVEVRMENDRGRIQKISVKHGEFKAYSSRDFQLTEEGKYKKGVKWGLVFGKNFKNKTEATWEAFPLGIQANFLCRKKKGLGQPFFVETANKSPIREEDISIKPE